MTVTEFLDSSATEHPYFVLFGRPVSHSLSPLIHNHALHYHKINASYYALHTEPDEEYLIPEVLKNDHFLGANITIPLKQKIREFVDEESDVCKTIGAVNTVVSSSGKLFGYNTDVDGFIRPLKQFEEQLKEKPAVVFGSGGASRAIVYALLMMGCKHVHIISRNPQKIHLADWFQQQQISFNGYDDIDRLVSEAAILVNTTPLGMEPNIDSSPLPDSFSGDLNDKICYDIVYKPLHTKFLKNAENLGGIPVQGLDMFVGQAAVSFKLWTGYPFTDQDAKKMIIKKLNL